MNLECCAPLPRWMWACVVSPLLSWGLFPNPPHTCAHPRARHQRKIAIAESRGKQRVMPGGVPDH